MLSTDDTKVTISCIGIVLIAVLANIVWAFVWCAAKWSNPAFYLGALAIDGVMVGALVLAVRKFEANFRAVFPSDEE